MNTYEIAVIPGDGIGKEIVPESLKVLDLLAEIDGGFRFQFTEVPCSCDYYEEHGQMMPDDGLEQLKSHEAIFLGSIGDPERVPDHISLWGSILKIRREFQQVINLRPAKLIKGVHSPLADPQDFDFIVVRENSEGEYSEIGGRIHEGEDQIAIQNAVFTRKGTERTIRYAFELAQKSNGNLTSATKSNGIFHTMPFWNDVFKEVARDYPDVETKLTHIDALSAFFVTKPQEFDVVVGSNLFGDILTDLGAAIMGSIGIAPAANINLNGKYPSMFEPVHGSAPDIYGQGIANPIGQLWTAKMMLDHFGHEEIGTLLLETIEETLEAGVKTPDLGGKYSTTEVVGEMMSRLTEKA